MTIGFRFAAVAALFASGQAFAVGCPGNFHEFGASRHMSELTPADFEWTNKLKKQRTSWDLRDVSSPEDMRALSQALFQVNLIQYWATGRDIGDGSLERQAKVLATENGAKAVHALRQWQSVHIVPSYCVSEMKFAEDRNRLSALVTVLPRKGDAKPKYVMSLQKVNGRWLFDDFKTLPD